MFLQGKICVSARVGNVYCPNLASLCSFISILVEKISPRLFIQTIKCYLLDKKIVYQSFYGAPLTFSYFLLQGKVLFRTRRQVTCEMFISKAFRRPCRKNNISGYIWHKLFIQTVKCSFFSHVIVDQSFYGALLTISYFLLQGKIVCFPRVGNSLVRCLFP